MTPLSKLHQTYEGGHMRKQPPRSGHDPFRRAWMTAMRDKTFRQKCSTVIDEFIAEVVCPLMPLEDEDDGVDPDVDPDVGNVSTDLPKTPDCPEMHFPRRGGRRRVFIVQSEPSVRVHVPHVKP